MEIALRKQASVTVENLKPGNELTPTMPSGNLVVNGASFPFILRKQIKGTRKALTECTENAILVIDNVIRHPTQHSRAGYESIFVIFGDHAFDMYMKSEIVPAFVDLLNTLPDQPVVPMI
jgi:hypothetical protein